jgi:hypothetical protein
MNGALRGVDRQVSVMDCGAGRRALCDARRRWGS